MEELGRALIDDVHRRVVTGYPAQVRASLEALSDEQVWWRPYPSSNAVGNLVLHTCGSTRHFLGRGLGGSSYRRDRPREFAEKGLSRAQLLAVLEETVAEAERVLGALDPARLLEVTDRAGEPQTALAILLRTAHHWGVHTGQIVFATKALKEGAFDELWMKTMR
jgi:uncharacterized damage-inducible protein DinB